MKINISIWNQNTCTADWHTCKYCERDFTVDGNYVNIYSRCTRCSFITKLLGNDICPHAAMGSFPRCVEHGRCK